VNSPIGNPAPISAIQKAAWKQAAFFLVSYFRLIAGLLERRVRAFLVQAGSAAVEHFVAGACWGRWFSAAGASPDVVLEPVALCVAFLEGHTSVQIRLDFHGHMLLFSRFDPRTPGLFQPAHLVVALLPVTQVLLAIFQASARDQAGADL